MKKYSVKYELNFFLYASGLPTAGVLPSSSIPIQDPNYVLTSASQHMNYPFSEVCKLVCHILICNITILLCQALSHGPWSLHTDISTLIHRHFGFADRRTSDHYDPSTRNGVIGYWTAIKNAAQRTDYAGYS